MNKIDTEIRKRRKKVFTEFCRDFADVPLIIFLFFSCSVVSTGVISWYFHEYFMLDIRIAIGMIFISSLFSLILFLFAIVFVEWHVIGQKLRKKYPPKDIFEVKK